MLEGLPARKLLAELFGASVLVLVGATAIIAATAGEWSARMMSSDWGLRGSQRVETPPGRGRLSVGELQDSTDSRSTTEALTNAIRIWSWMRQDAAGLISWHGEWGGLVARRKRG